MLRKETKSTGVFVCGEVRRGKIHSVTKELIGKARELADKKSTHVSVILLCEELADDTHSLFRCGADRLLLVKNKQLKYFNQEMTGLLKSNMDFYKRVADNEKLRDKLKLALFDLLYEGFDK